MPFLTVAHSYLKRVVTFSQFLCTLHFLPRTQYGLQLSYGPFHHIVWSKNEKGTGSYLLSTAGCGVLFCPHRPRSCSEKLNLNTVLSSFFLSSVYFFLEMFTYFLIFLFSVENWNLHVINLKKTTA